MGVSSGVKVLAEQKSGKDTVAGRTEDSWMAGASVSTTFGAGLAGRWAAAELEGPASSSSPCKSSSVRLIACAGCRHYKDKIHVKMKILTRSLVSSYRSQPPSPPKDYCGSLHTLRFQDPLTADVPPAKH